MLAFRTRLAGSHNAEKRSDSALLGGHWGVVRAESSDTNGFRPVFGALLLRHINKNASLTEAFLFKGKVAGLMRSLRFAEAQVFCTECLSSEAREAHTGSSRF